MSPQRIRPLALCVFGHDGRILVNEAHDPVKSQSYCRPLGGGIQFGELSAHAIVREIREELGVEIGNLRLIGTLENIFIHLGEPGHEIVQVYDGEFVDRALYRLPYLSGEESDHTPFNAHWRGKSYFSARLPLYPHGLMELLELHSLIHAAA
jgi:8-oxo-dGTP pyrophosphatase MutT (NUDIX family)